MNFKIIETPAEYPDVLVHRDRDENGKELVKLLAFGTIYQDDDSNAIAEETVSFVNYEAAQAFVHDFSYESAVAFRERPEIRY